MLPNTNITLRIYNISIRLLCSNIVVCSCPLFDYHLFSPSLNKTVIEPIQTIFREVNTAASRIIVTVSCYHTEYGNKKACARYYCYELHNITRTGTSILF